MKQITVSDFCHPIRIHSVATLTVVTTLVVTVAAIIAVTITAT